LDHFESASFCTNFLLLPTALSKTLVTMTATVLNAFIQLALVTIVTGKCKFISPDTSLRSSSQAGRQVEIQFSNPGDGEFDIFWLDRSMNEVNMGKLDSWEELGYITNEGMAWRLKLHDTSLVVLEYVIHTPLEEPLILNSAEQPLIALTVGEGCTKDDKDQFVSEGLKDPLKLFTSDKKDFVSRSRSPREDFGDLDEVVRLEVDSSAEVLRSLETTGSPAAPPVSGEGQGQEQQAAGCMCADAEKWLNRHLGVEGYHVLCVTKPPQRAGLTHALSPGIRYEVQAWEEGYLSIPNDQTYDAATFGEFRAQLEDLFSIRRTDAWRVRSAEAIRQQSDLPADGSSKWAFLPQRWRLFDVHRQPVESLLAVRDQQLLLLLEGGQFMYPGVDLGFEREVSAAGSQFTITTLSMRPLLLQVDNLLEDEECAYMIDHARPLMVPSDVSLMDRDKGKPATDFRTSQYVFMTTRSHEVLKRIDARIANVTGLDILNQEDTTQILKYEVGNYYLSHNDYWSPVHYQSRDMVKMTQAGHKNRLATVLWYMNRDVEGGCTSFTHAPVHNAFASQTVAATPPNPPHRLESSDPVVQDMVECDYGLKVAPKKGRAIIFYSLLPSGNGDDYAEHAACAVTRGTKWAANKWIWNQVRW
jgi:prolyl 4-hydroxylase